MTTPTIHILMRRCSDPLADPNVVTASADAGFVRDLANVMRSEGEDVYVELTALDNPAALADYGITPPSVAADPRQLALC